MEKQKERKSIFMVPLAPFSCVVTVKSHSVVMEKGPRSAKIRKEMGRGGGEGWQCNENHDNFPMVLQSFIHENLSHSPSITKQPFIRLCLLGIYLRILGWGI
jgi:hypothetical protein